MKQLIIGISVLLLATAANADGPLMSTVPAIVKQECAACHIVYPPQFLPKQSWVNILNNLDKHFGTDASLDAKTVKNVSDWIMQDNLREELIKQFPAEVVELVERRKELKDSIDAAEAQIKEINGKLAVVMEAYRAQKIKGTNFTVSAVSKRGSVNYGEIVKAMNDENGNW